MPPLAKKQEQQAPQSTQPPAEAAGGKPKKAKKAPTVAKETVEVEQPVSVARPIIYPFLRAEICAGINAITEKDAKQALGWETEKEYQSRMMLAHPGTQAKTWEYGDVYMLRDEEGNKIRCINNLDNRPFDEGWCRGLAQSILRGQWAGSITIPDRVMGIYGNSRCEPVEIDGVVYKPGDPMEYTAGTVNGSTIVISRTGRVESGQHSLCALILAYQMWWKDKNAYPFWADKTRPDPNFGEVVTGPVIETILVTGVSEERRVLMTVDNCKPRSEADVFYTSELFQRFRDQPGKRKEMSRMLAACIDLFWKRTDAKGYKTHAEVMSLVERHPRLLKSLEHIFTENADTKRRADGSLVGGRLLSNLRLSPGQCVALCYIMGCSASDGDAYRNSIPPSEKGLSWSRWDDAKEFWALLGSHESFLPLRMALGRLVEGDPDSEDKPGLGGRLLEKLALLAKAWEMFIAERKVFTMLDLEPGGCLHLTYSAPKTTTVTKENGEVEHVYTAAMLEEDDPDFGGIDCPEQSKMPTATPKAPTKEELEKRAEDLRMAKARETAEKIRQMRLSESGKPVAPKPVTGPSTESKPALRGGVG